MDRKQIIEKQKALGGICQSKTGDVILRKNVFETRVLKTKLTELETEERRWKTSFSYDVKEARKEALNSELAKCLSFRQVGKAAMASHRFKNLLPATTTKSRHDIAGIQGTHKNIEDTAKQFDKQSSKEQEGKQCNKEEPKVSQRQDRNLNITKTTSALPPPVKTKDLLRHSYSLPERSPSFPSPKFTRRRGETFTGRSRNPDLSKKKTNGIITHGINPSDVISPRSWSSTTLEKPSVITSPMLDRRFLELEAALVPLHLSTSEGEEGEDDDVEDLAACDDISSSII